MISKCWKHLLYYGTEDFTDGDDIPLRNFQEMLKREKIVGDTITLLHKLAIVSRYRQWDSLFKNLVSFNLITMKKKLWNSDTEDMANHNQKPCFDKEEDDVLKLFVRPKILHAD